MTPYAIARCKGKDCPKASQCQRYTDTKEWRMKAMSRICDNRYVAFVPKEKHA